MFFMRNLLETITDGTSRFVIIQNVISATAIPNKKRLGRPRSSQTEKAILRAAGEIVLASGGLAELTIEGVAARAGVGKASIYRRWPSKGALAFDAVVDGILATQPTPDTGSLESDLARVAENWIRLSNVRRGGRAVAHFIAEVQSDPDLAVAWRERFVDPIRKARRPIIERAISRGELPGGSDPELIMDMLFGPLYHRYLNGHLPLDQSFATGVARMVAAGATAGAAIPDQARDDRL
jgi:AcrR family transcriptional regulator